MKAIVINRKLTKKELAGLNNITDENVKVFVAPHIRLSGIKNKTVLPFSISDSEKSRINKSMMTAILDFGEKEVEGKSLTELFTFEKVSIWHYNKFRVYFAARNKLYEIKAVENILKQYDKVIFYGQDELLKNFVNGKKIVFVLPQKEKTGYNYFQLFKYFVFFKIRVLLGTFLLLKIKNKKNIVIDHVVKQKILDIDTLKPVYDNYNLAYLFKRLDNNFFILDDVDFPQKKSDYKFNFKSYLFKTKNRIYIENILLAGLLNSGVRKRTGYLVKLLNSRKKEVSKTEMTDYEKLIFHYFDNYSKNSFIYFFKYFAFKKFFESHKIETVTTIDENSPRIKSVLDAAKFYGIKTFGIQHGSINELHPAYMFTKNDIKRNITTDFTLAWGNYWKKILTEKGNYDEGSIIITGQIRTDIIPKLIKSDISLFNRPYALFATQPQRDAVLRKSVTGTVFSAFAKRNDLLLVIKLHPAEKNDIPYYESIVENSGLKNYIIVYSEDLYLLLSKCSMVITSFSTVGTEAVYFKKPLIIVDPLKQDIQNYKKSGVAFQVTNDEELSEIVEDLLLQKTGINEKAYKKFINDFAYKIDGKTSQRVLNVINRNGKESR